jgi:hypothetical protein
MNVAGPESSYINGANLTVDGATNARSEAEKPERCRFLYEQPVNSCMYVYEHGTGARRRRP